MKLKAPEITAPQRPVANYHPNYTQTWNATRLNNAAFDASRLVFAIFIMVGSEGLLVIPALGEAIQSSVNLMTDLIGTDEDMVGMHEVTKIFSVYGMWGGIVGMAVLPLNNAFEVGFAIGELGGDMPGGAKAGKEILAGPAHFIHDGPTVERFERWSIGPKIIHDAAEGRGEGQKSEIRSSEATPKSQPGVNPTRPSSPAPSKPKARPGPPVGSGRMGSNGNDVHSGARGGGPIFDGGRGNHRGTA